MHRSTLPSPRTAAARVAGYQWFAITLVALAYLGSSPALAQKIYKCSDASGTVVYQQLPCTSPSQAQEVREYAAEPRASEPAGQGEPSVEATAATLDYAVQSQPADTASRRPVPTPAATLRAQRDMDERVAAARMHSCAKAKADRDKEMSRSQRTIRSIRDANASVERTCGGR